MYFDPLIYKHIKELKLDGVNINKFIVVFWDISKFSDLIKELKILMKKRIKKQGLIFHEVEYLLRDYYSEAIRVIKKNNGILDKFIGDGIFAYFGYQDKKFDIVLSKAMDAALELKMNFIKIKEKHMKILYSHYDYEPATNINLKCAMHIHKDHLDTGILLFEVRLLLLEMMLISVVDSRDLLIMIKLSFRKS